MGILRRLLQIGLLLVTLVIGVSSAAIIVSQTAWFRDWLRGFIVRQGNQYLNGRLTIGRLGGNIFFGIELENIELSMDGEPVVTLKDARIAYSVLQLLTRNLVITSLRLNEPTLHMRRDGGNWDLTEIVKPQAPSKGGSNMPLRIEDIVVTGGSFAFADQPVGTAGVDVPRDINRLDARLSVAYAPERYTIDISNVSFRGQSPSFGLNAMSGRVAVSGSNLYLQKVAVRTASSEVKIDGAIYNYGKAPSLDVHASSRKLDFNEIARIVPSLGRIDLQPAFDVTANGPLNNLHLTFDVKSKAGEVSGDVVADAEAPDQRVAGTVHLRDVNLAPVLRDPRKRTDVTGAARVDVRLLKAGDTSVLRGTYNVQAEKIVGFGYAANDVTARGRIDGDRMVVDAAARAYGMRATAAGTVRLPLGNSTLGYDMKGRIGNVDLRRLPRTLGVPPAETNLNLDYRVSGSGPVMKGNVLLQPSTLAGARIDGGSRASFTYGGGQLAYSADATVAGLNLQRVGQQFKVAALSSPRFGSDVNGRLTVTGSGATLAATRADATLNLVNSSLLGMRVPAFNVQANLTDGTARATANGSFSQLNPAQISGNEALNGQVGGSLQLTVGVRNVGAAPGTSSMLDNVSADGRLTLQPSSVGGFRMDSANIDGRYANRAGDIRQFTVKGPDVQLQASGPIALTDQGQSNLRYQLATPNLTAIGKLAGTPVEGAASLAGQVTGNGTALRTTGTLKGANLGYAGSQALNMTSEYDVTLPNLDPSQVKVGATTTATFVKAAGQEINKVTAKTTFVSENLDFDATLEQPKRSLTVAGDILLHPQHSEVHLRHLGLQASGMHWDTPPGTAPAIQYGGGAIAVKDFRLVSGSQQITAEGTIGPSSSNLQARLSNFNLANVDAIMLTNRQLGGTLNAQATLTGPRDAMRIAGQFDVSGGSFRQFRYQSLAGKIDFAANRVGLDVRLQENPQAWIVATGSVPTAVFSAASSPAEAAQPVDLRVDSSALDLGLVQGFTTAVQNVTGTARANLRLTGTAGDPHVDGGLTITNGGFKVVPTGVAYSNLNAGIVLQPDRVTVQNLSITDNHKASLTLAGDLALHERHLGGVNVVMRGHDFKVVDNEFGNVRINSDVRVGGEVRAPRITGTLGINTGTINIDKVLDVLTSSAYSMTAETVPTTEGGQPASQPIGQPVNQPAREAATANKLPETPAEHNARKAAPPPSSPSGNPYDAATIDVQFAVPDDLVIKGNDIRVGQSSVGMGNVNLTLGGNVRVQKDPGGEPRLLGTVQTIRGTYDFQGRRFDIQRGGTVRFEGFQPPNPSLDLTATRLITGVEARVHVGGSVQRPQLTLTSNPPLDQADILSLIVFGQPSNQLGEGQQVSLAQRAETLAGGFVAGKLAQSIGNALNLDTFEIQTGSDTGESGATVTVGEQLGQRLYVKLRQGVGADNMTQFVLDYQLTNFLRFESTMTQGGTTTQNIMQPIAQSGADLIFMFSY